MRLRRLLYPLIFVLVGCQTYDVCYAPTGRANYTKYSPQPDDVSPKYGFGIDGRVDLALLDHTVDATLTCVLRVWPTMTQEDKAKAWCTGTPALEAKTCLIVKIPTDVYVSQCTGNQVFACSVPDASCEAKGQTPTVACPCTCRAMIQDQDMIITAPNLELFPARFTELVTGCDQIWAGPLKECGNPSLVGGGVP